MYKRFRDWCERVLRIPGDPEPPPGDESSTRLFRAAPNFYKYLLFLWAVRTFVFVVILFPLEIIPIAAGLASGARERGITFLFIPLSAVILGIVLVWRIIALALVRLDFEKRWYLVTDRSLRVREGVVNVREMTITFANIQNISISQGPIQRLLGIADLRVDTAGGGPSRGDKKEGGESLHTVRFRGVDNANEIRELITERLRGLKDSGLGDRDEMLTSRQPPILSGEPAVIGAFRELAAEATALRRAVEVAG
ncbi:MAG TPA: PH domain-containing protein [Chthoniobacterales bacterium]|nr:PH domain-containing protein [Chthoniobacterales bacterium]